MSHYQLFHVVGVNIVTAFFSEVCFSHQGGGYRSESCVVRHGSYTNQPSQVQLEGIYDTSMTVTSA